MSNEEKKEFDLFDVIFHQSNTYSELPVLFEKVGYEVSRSTFDSLKEYSLIYHLSGLSHTLESILKGIKQLEDEARILDLNLEDEMDPKDYKLYLKISNMIAGIQKEKLASSENLEAGPE